MIDITSGIKLTSTIIICIAESILGGGIKAHYLRFKLNIDTLFYYSMINVTLEVKLPLES